MSESVHLETQEHGVRLIETTNECFAFLVGKMFASGKTCNSTSLSCRRIGDMIRFLNRKFEREEELMRSFGFPGLHAHAADHSAFLARMNEAHRTLVCGQYDAVALSEEIDAWAAVHAETFDVPLIRFLLETAPSPILSTDERPTTDRSAETAASPDPARRVSRAYGHGEN